jgi:hypothetical protein
MKLTRIVFLAAAVMIPTTWTMAVAGEQAAPAGEKTEKTTKSKKEGAAGDTKAAPDSADKKTEKKAEKK